MLLCALLIACTSQPLTVTREPEVIRIISGESCAPLAEALATAYEGGHPWISVEVEIVSLPLVEQAVRQEGVDLGLCAWLREESGGDPLWATPFVHTAVAVIVHPDFPAQSIDLGRLHEIFRGRVQELEGQLLVVVIREDGSGTRAVFDQIVLRDREPALTALVMPSSRAVIDHVASTSSAIGYVSIIRLTDADLDWVRILPIDGVAPTPDAVASGRYVLSQQLFLVSHRDPVGPARDLAQWILGPEGQSVVAGVGAW
jgi:phosphate transport system substrate-binding protein